MNTPTKMPATGSGHVHPVQSMIPPVTTTPSETDASPRMGRNALRRIRSRPLRCRTKATAPLMATPTAATARMPAR